MSNTLETQACARADLSSGRFASGQSAVYKDQLWAALQACLAGVGAASLQDVTAAAKTGQVSAELAGVLAIARRFAAYLENGGQQINWEERVNLERRIDVGPVSGVEGYLAGGIVIVRRYSDKTDFYDQLCAIDVHTGEEIAATDAREVIENARPGTFDNRILVYSLARPVSLWDPFEDSYTPLPHQPQEDDWVFSDATHAYYYDHDKGDADVRVDRVSFADGTRQTFMLPAAYRPLELAGTTREGFLILGTSHTDTIPYGLVVLDPDPDGLRHLETIGFASKHYDVLGVTPEDELVYKESDSAQSIIRARTSDMREMGLLDNADLYEHICWSPFDAGQIVGIRKDSAHITGGDWLVRYDRKESKKYHIAMLEKDAGGPGSANGLTVTDEGNIVVAFGNQLLVYATSKEAHE